MNESVPNKSAHWASPRQLCWSERHISPFPPHCWLWRYHNFILQSQRHSGAKLWPPLLQCNFVNLLMCILYILQWASDCHVRSSCTAAHVTVPLTATSFRSLSNCNAIILNWLVPQHHIKLTPVINCCAHVPWHRLRSASRSSHGRCGRQRSVYEGFVHGMAESHSH